MHLRAQGYDLQARSPSGCHTTDRHYWTAEVRQHRNRDAWTYRRRTGRQALQDGKATVVDFHARVTTVRVYDLDLGRWVASDKAGTTPALSLQ